MAEDFSVRIETEGPVASLVLGVSNSGSLGAGIDLQRLYAVVAEIEQDTSLRALLVHLEGEGSAIEEEGVASPQALLNSLRSLPVPVVVSLHEAVGELASILVQSGDWILASDEVVFSQLLAGPGSFDAPISAARALQAGLLHECLPSDQLMSRAREIAQQLAQGPTEALVQTRRLVDESAENDFETQCRRELEVNQVLRESADGREGVQAFLEKRPARFRGR